jgi:SPP1 gp7 family putative phage head morphogenesis protein
MATANEIIFNEDVAHNIDLQGFSNGVVKRMLKLLNKVDADLMAQITIALDKMPVNQFNVARLETLLISVRALNSEAYATISNELNNELQSLVAYELSYQETQIKNVLPAMLQFTSVEAVQVYAAVQSRPFSGRLLSDWLSGLEQSRAIKIRDAIRIGYVEGQTINDIVRRIRGARSLNYADGLLDISRRDAEAIVRTAISHTANYAREQLFAANDEVIKGFRYTATIDARTTLLCSSRDANFYALGKPKPAIPAHINCRSLYVAVLKSWQEMGLEIDELPESTCSSLDGQIPATMSYNDWLKKQSIERQNDILGVTKAKLFRDGGLDLPKFISKQGHEYTIEQLRERDASAFTRAGL